MTLPPWDRRDIGQLLQLQRIGAGHWRTRHGEPNSNGRSYGGQLLGQGMMAALHEAPADRAPSMMQFLFLQGADPQQPVDLRVTRLQDGRRFTALHVRGSQGGDRFVLDAQVTCASWIEGPEHDEAFGHDLSREGPEASSTIDALPESLRGELVHLGGYSEDRKPSVEFRIPRLVEQFTRPGPTFRFWLRAGAALSDDSRVHSAAFAYLSDWWLNFSSLGLHREGLADRALYVSSLNHCIWFHRPVRADAWLHVESTSHGSVGGRGFSVARVHDEGGRLVASTSQQSLMGFAQRAARSRLGS